MKHLIYAFLITLILIPTLTLGVTTIIAPGGDVFLGEEGLDVRTAVPPPYDSIAFYPPGSSVGREMPLDVRRIETLQFSASPTLYSDRVGTWYQWDSRRAAPGSVAFTIREPRISVRVLQQRTMEDISAGTIPRGTPLYFQIDTNTGSVAQRPGYNPAVDGVYDLRITTPGGGVLTGIETMNRGTISLSRITPEGSLQSVPSVSTGGWNTGASGSGNYLYSDGTYRIQPKFSFNRVDENLRSDSRTFIINEASITLGSDRTRITVREEKITRGSSFSVTISGTPGVPVYFWVDAGSKSGSPGDQPPMILFAQEGVSQDNPDGPYGIGSYRPSSESGRSIRDLVPHDPYNGVKYYAMVNPDRDGKRTVELRTTDQTDDTQYTLKVETRISGSQPISDDTRITVVKGEVTVISGENTYAIGEEVRLSGSNSESCDTYLFITGPNLPSGGGRLDRPRQDVRTGVPSSFTIASGDCDTWQYTLYTGELGLDAGTYTIYAVPSPVDRYNLGSVPYQTIPLTLKRPYITLKQQETEVARGDSLILTGQSSGNGGSDVAIWMFGKNYFWYDQVPVERSGYFEYEIPGWQTSTMVAGQYSVIVQHPMANGEFDIWPDGSRQLVLGRYPYSGAPIFRVSGPGSLKGPDAANALLTALNSPYIDDTYSRWDIRVMSPKIEINASSLSQSAGQPIVIEGTTNLGAGKRLLVEITDNRFAPTSKNDRSESYGYSGTAEIYQNNGVRTFSLMVPAGTLAPGEYRLMIQAVESDAMTSGLLVVTPPAQAPVQTNVSPTLVTAVGTPIMLENTSAIQMPATLLTTIVPTMTPEKNVSTPLTTSIPTPVSTPGSVAASDDRMISLLTGVGVGLLIAVLVGGIVFLFRRKEKEEEEVDETGETMKEDDVKDEGDEE